ncbi:hypothetical protein HKX48_005648 [Thoreauomyces humboldtii]|nr:hypothetical protein HKX48_005648 [Thoreauomyces humboldtii]
MTSNGYTRNIPSAAGGGASGADPSKAAPLKYGLILRGKNAPPSKPSATTKFAIGRKLTQAKAFGSDSDDDDEANKDEVITSFSSLKGGPGSSSEQRKVNVELRAVQAQRSKLAEEEHRKALEEDPNVFDYDAVYDGIKQAEIDKKKTRDNPDGGVIKKVSVSARWFLGALGRPRTLNRFDGLFLPAPQPRYMAALIKASAQRKIDLERAELRKVQREREEEGEEFGDKEKFVTGAYKQQMADLKRTEEEEKRREAMESDVTKGGDLTSFYRDILNQSEHAAPVPVAAKEALGGKEADPDVDDEAAGLRKAAIREGVVQVNDSEEVVDKRQLLKGGLNLTSRTVKRLNQEREEREREAREYAARKLAEEQQRAAERRAAKEQQARARELVIRQQSEKEEEDRKRKADEREDMVKKMARQTTENTVSDARARYLARKKAQARESDDSD